MTNERRVLVHPGQGGTGELRRRPVHHEAASTSLDAQDGRTRRAHRRHRWASAVLEAIGGSPARDSRRLDAACTSGGATNAGCPHGDADRNDEQARMRCSTTWTCPRRTCIRSRPRTSGPTSTPRPTPTRRSSRQQASTGPQYPIFDIIFLGVGPDGHVASLFPDRTASGARDGTVVVAVRNSPKPPPERLSLTLPVINSSRADLARPGRRRQGIGALGLALAGASRDEVPVAGVEGRRRTVFFVDQEAAAEVPEDAHRPRVLTGTAATTRCQASGDRSAALLSPRSAAVHRRDAPELLSASSRSVAASSSVRRSFT